MAFKKKGAPSAKSLDFPASDPRSGSAATNSKGQYIEQVTPLNWPYQRFTTDNELNPKSNQGKPDQLSNSPQAFGDFTVDGKQGGLDNVRSTLG